MLKICTSQQFVEVSEELDQIICFGAGKRLALLAFFFENGKVWNKIKCIVDNDASIWNTRVRVGKKEFEVISINELKGRKYNNFAIVITCSQYEDILNQLNTDSVLYNIDFYCLSHMWRINQEEEALKKTIPSDIKLSKEPLIPKVIHYCWFGRNPLPDQCKIWMESWHKYCPDYDIVEWNEDNYDITKNKYMRQAYGNGKWGFVSDYARLDIVYNYGGIYLDTDVELIQNIDDMLYQKGFAGFESREYVNSGIGFAAIKGLPIIGKMRDAYDGLEFMNQDGSLNMIPCPHIQTSILEKYGLHKNGEYQIVDELSIYPEKMLCGKSIYTKRIVLKPYTRAIHHYTGSWLDEEKKDKVLQLEKEMALYR